MTQQKPALGGQGGHCMKSYTVLFIRKSNNRMGFDVFTADSAEAAKRSFLECYRHEDYLIVAVTEKLEVKI